MSLTHTHPQACWQLLILYLQALSGGPRPSSVLGGIRGATASSAQFEDPPLVTKAVGQPPKSFPLVMCHAGRYTCSITPWCMYFCLLLCCVNEHGAGIWLLVGVCLCTSLWTCSLKTCTISVMLLSTDRWHALAYCLSADTQ